MLLCPRVRWTIFIQLQKCAYSVFLSPVPHSRQVVSLSDLASLKTGAQAPYMPHGGVSVSGSHSAMWPLGVTGYCSLPSCSIQGVVSQGLKMLEWHSWVFERIEKWEEKEDGSDCISSQGCHNKVPQVGVVSNKNVSHSPGGCKSKISVSLAGMVPSEGREGRICFRPFSLACRWLTSPCLCTMPFFHACLCPDFPFL